MEENNNMTPEMNNEPAVDTAAETAETAQANTGYGTETNDAGFTPSFTPAQEPVDPVVAQKNKFELASLILGIVSLVCCNPMCICSILAIVFAFKARNLSGSTKFEGKNLAGLICGAIGIGMFVIGMIVSVLYYVLIIIANVAGAM